MFHVPETLVAVMWFLALAGLANLLQYKFSITYQKHWFIFVILFPGIAIPGILFTTSLDTNPSLYNEVGIISGFVSLVFFLSFLSWWGRTYGLTDMYGYETLKPEYHQLLTPNFTSALSKASEILIQDIVLLVIVTELITKGFSYIIAGTVFAIIVLLVHIPALKIIGRIYGLITLVFATVSAFLIPFIIGEIAHGFYIVFSLH